jgi:hypothetical protein
MQATPSQSIEDKEGKSETELVVNKNQLNNARGEERR